MAGHQPAHPDPGRADAGHRRRHQGGSDELIAELAAKGLAIILISSEMPELIGMCDRIVVLREGHRTAEFTRVEATGKKCWKRRQKPTSASIRPRRLSVPPSRRRKNP